MIGRLVGMMTYARTTTLAAVNGLTTAELDHLHDSTSNSIGALLAHITVVERAYQVMTFEGRALSAEEEKRWEAALSLGELGRAVLRGKPLDEYLGELAAVREATLQTLAARGDDWLECIVEPAPRMNMHWAWFHVMEDEVNHRGQMRWLRARLPKREGDKSLNA